MAKPKRKPLTTKARKAIILYIQLRMKGQSSRTNLEAIVTYAFTAERMSREKLYATVHNRGYVWKRGRWVKAKRKLTPKVLLPHPTKKTKKTAAKAKTRTKKPPQEATQDIPDSEEELIQRIRDGSIAIRPAKQRGEI